MRMRWAAGVLVVALVVAAGCYGFYRWDLRRQQNSYAAGHAAYLRADCGTALPELDAARDGRFDQPVARRARADADACRGYEKVRTTAARQAPEAAIGTFVAYVVGKPRGPLVDAGRLQVRNSLRTLITQGKPSYRMCTRRESLTTPKLVRIKPSDDLAAPWLAACARTMAAEKGWGDARRALVELRTALPRSQEAKATLGDLVTISGRAAATVPDVVNLSADMLTGTVAGKHEARLYLANGSDRPLDVTISGKKPGFTRIPACPACQPRGKGDQGCDTIHDWKHGVIRVPVGRHEMQLWQPAPDHWDFDTVRSGSLDFRAGGVYVWCTWN